MNNQYLNCICQQKIEVDHDQLLETLEFIRNKCPALKHIFLPDKHWDKFKTADQTGGRTLDDTHHRSIFLLGLERSYLEKITLPIHMFLLEGNSIAQKINRDYKVSLAETWVLEPDIQRRQKIFRVYMGKLVELIFAEHLKSHEFEILNLEAWNPGNDITAKKERSEFEFEVKFIGLDDEGFEYIVQSLAGTPGVERKSPYCSANYLLFRVYEAAKQLTKIPNKRKKVSTVIIDGTTLHNFKIPLKDNYVKWWDKPKFFDNPGWEKFIKDQKIKKQYPNMESEIGALLNKLFGIYFFEINRFEIKKLLKTKNAAISQ